MTDGQARVMIDYLVWVKDLHRDLQHEKIGLEMIDLTSSAVRTPHELLRIDMEEGTIESMAKEPEPWGSSRLIRYIASRYGADPESVFLTAGASSGILLVSLAYVRNGDHVLVESPVYEPVHAIPRYLGAEVSYLRRAPERDYGVDLSELGSSIRKNTRLIFLTNLHNPSGRWLKDEELDGIADVVKQASKDVKVVVDEVYHDFVRGEQPSAAMRGDPFVTLNSLSKVYGLWVTRCGWILASNETIDTLRSVFVLAENVGSPLCEAVAESVFSRMEAHESHWKSFLPENRSYAEGIYLELVKEGKLRGAFPEVGCICFPGIVGVKDTRTFTRKLADRTGVLVTPGEFFDQPGHVRIGLGGDPESVKEGFVRFAEFVRAGH